MIVTRKRKDPKRMVEINSNYDNPSPIYTRITGLQLANNWTAKVSSYKGDYIEIANSDIIGENIKVKEGQEWRYNYIKYPNARYAWLTPTDDSDVKIYNQFQPVSYADYKPKHWYIDVNDVFIEDLNDQYQL